LYEQFRDDREFAVGMVPIYDNLSEYTGMLREFADYMEESLKRLMLAYSGRTDMEDVFKEGKYEQADQEVKNGN
jgi:hypothetical protein